MMDLRYLDYMYDGYDYFVKLSRIKDCYKVEEFSNDTWETSVSEDGHWVQKSLIGQELPNQGWKIHISSNLKDAQLLLDKVSKVCLKEEVTFKYVKDDLELSKKILNMPIEDLLENL